MWQLAPAVLSVFYRPVLAWTIENPISVDNYGVYPSLSNWSFLLDQAFLKA